MSRAAEADEKVCANCGIAEGDDIKLEDCGGCDLVKYCNDGYRELHRPEHAGECKKRVKELHERKLFDQPDETHLGECPICFLPLSLDQEGKSMFYPCCSERICNGCAHANIMSNKHDIVKAGNCPFCREPISSGDEETCKRIMKRIKANDPAALCQMATGCYEKSDYDGAFEYFTKAAELGKADAHHNLSCMYRNGQGVEKDEEKEVYHLEKAAVGGHPDARHNLGCYEERNGNVGRAVKHFIIAANLGLKESMKALWKHYSLGNIIKEELEATLRTHQAAIDEMKSEQRDVADRCFRM